MVSDRSVVLHYAYSYEQVEGYRGCGHSWLCCLELQRRATCTLACLTSTSLPGTNTR